MERERSENNRDASTGKQSDAVRIIDWYAPEKGERSEGWHGVANVRRFSLEVLDEAPSRVIGPAETLPLSNDKERPLLAIAAQKALPNDKDDRTHVITTLFTTQDNPLLKRLRPPGLWPLHDLLCQMHRQPR